jgi:hypothetical protein
MLEFDGSVAAVNLLHQRSAMLRFAVGPSRLLVAKHREVIVDNQL